MFIKSLLRPAAKFKILHRNLTPGGRGWRTVVAKLPERPVWKVDLIWYIFHLCCFTMRGWTQHRQHWIYIVTIYFLCPDTQSYKFTQIIYNDPCSFQCNDNDSSALQEILKEYLEVSSDSYLILNLPHTAPEPDHCVVCLCSGGQLRELHGINYAESVFNIKPALRRRRHRLVACQGSIKQGGRSKNRFMHLISIMRCYILSISILTLFCAFMKYLFFAYVYLM